MSFFDVSTALSTSNWCWFLTSALDQVLTQSGNTNDMRVFPIPLLPRYNRPLPPLLPLSLLLTLLPILPLLLCFLLCFLVLVQLIYTLGT